jgi:DNA-binding CsgD family transcriptional regulator
MVEAAVRAGAPEHGADAFAVLSETATASGTDWGLGIRARVQALLTDGDEAELCYRESVARLEQAGLRAELARSHLLYGEWLRRQNRRGDARAHLRTAHALLSAMGMAGFAERARRELMVTGETVRKRAVDSFDELTSQESNIARLATEGRTNPEIGAQLFISPRTVEWHLRKVFTKLDVKSRRELRDALSSRSRLTPSG